jgi:hypothetical protein
MAGILNANAAQSFFPGSLFANNEPGVWYDPSDMATLFQDSAGTTPVTAVEQPVGLILDKSGRGNHAIQSTSTARPVLSARYNLLTRTEEFDNAYWGTASRVTIAANTTDTTDPLGGNTAEKMTEVAVSGTHRVAANGEFAAAAGLATSTMRSSVYLKKGTRDWGWIALTNIDNSGATAYFDLTNGLVGTVSVTGTGSGASAQITAAANGWYLCTLTVKPSTSTGDVFTYYGMTTGDGTNSYTGDTSKNIYIWGADLRVANDGVGIPVYQRVGAGTAGSSSASGSADYDTAGFPLYLRADGTDDSLATAAINFSATDAVTVWAGVRKLSDAARGTVVELTASAASNNGSFHLTAPNAASATYAFESKGTSLTDAVAATGVAAPNTSVLCAYSDISSDLNILRVNGVQADSDTGDQGSGNFANSALYIGSRGGSSLRFNGRIYGLIVRGSASATSEINDTERWLATKTGITL